MIDVVAFIKIQVALLAMYILYKLVFSRGTILQARRWFLLGILPVAVVSPFLILPAESGTWLYASQVLNEVVVDAVDQSSDTLDENIGWALATWIYLLAIGLLFLLFMVKLVRLWIQISRTPAKREGVYRVVQMPAHTAPGSFFKTIFMPEGLDEDTVKIITQHEKIHARQWHSLDVLYYEVAGLFCWMNPIIYLLQKELKLVHEYIADQATAGGQPDVYCQTLLAFKMGVPPSSFIHPFISSNTIKNRMIMLQQSFSLRQTLLRVCLIVPFVAAMLMVNAGIAQVESEEVLQQAEIMPEFPGGQDAMFQYLVQELKYPEESRKKKEEGRVFVSFIVTSSGEVTRAEVKKSASPLLDAEALRVVNNMPTWKPGESNGKKVNVYYTLPISFKLD